MCHRGNVTLNSWFIRVLDLIVAVFFLILLFPVGALLCVIGYLDTGSPLFVQQRVGKGLTPFGLIKFRSMVQSTKSVATHLVDPRAVTPYGSFLRRSKLDELPQLLNVVKGDMGLVGPRPCLFSQQDLIVERQKRGVFAVRPGITGLAQIKGIDMSTPSELAECDVELIRCFSVRSYLRILIKTIVGKGRGDRIARQK